MDEAARAEALRQFSVGGINMNQEDITIFPCYIRGCKHNEKRFCVRDRKYNSFEYADDWKHTDLRYGYYVFGKKEKCAAYRKGSIYIKLLSALFIKPKEIKKYLYEV